MKVRITKASNSAYWYADRIGNIYKTEDYDLMKLKVVELFECRLIDKFDCEIIKEPEFKFAEDRSVMTHGGEKVAPNPKYCPAGKIECEYLGHTNILTSGVRICKSSGISYCNGKYYKNLAIENFETCPWPSRQKPIEDKYEKAWNLVRYGEGVTISQEDFIKFLKEAGL